MTKMYSLIFFEVFGISLALVTITRANKVWPSRLDKNAMIFELIRKKNGKCDYD